MAYDRGRHLIIRTDKDTHFVGALAQNAGEAADIVLDLYTAMAATRLGAKEPAKSARLIVREIRIWSDQNLAWELQFWADDDYEETNADLDAFLGSHKFAVSDGAQNAGTGLYRYCQTKLELFYTDRDLTGEVHLKLFNRSATSKNAGATGEVVVELAAEWA